MDFTISYVEELNAIVLKTEGSITVIDSLRMIDAEVDMLEQYPKASILYDQTQSTAENITSDHIIKISEYSARLGELMEGKKLAVVLVDNLGYGLGRMWQSFTETKVPFEIKLFRTYEEAEEWIKS